MCKGVKKDYHTFFVILFVLICFTGAIISFSHYDFEWYVILSSSLGISILILGLGILTVNIIHTKQRLLENNNTNNMNNMNNMNSMLV